MVSEGKARGGGETAGYLVSLQIISHPKPFFLFTGSVCAPTLLFQGHCRWMHRRRPAQLINSSVPLRAYEVHQAEAGHMTSPVAKRVRFG